jgi:hypothetical protein
MDVRELSKISPVTDSPWFWVLVYSAVPLVALALLSQKYAARQSQLERQYQARERVAEGDPLYSSSAQPAEDAQREPTASYKKQVNRRSYSSPNDTLISLKPLIALFLAAASCAAIMLVRQLNVAERAKGPPALDKTSHPAA